jgi:hypothetical protein
VGPTGTRSETDCAVEAVELQPERCVANATNPVQADIFNMSLRVNPVMTFSLISRLSFFKTPVIQHPT